MRKRLLIGCLCLSVLSMMAQTNEPTSAAGYDFYFTLFDHWGWSGNSDEQTKYCGYTVCATEAGDMTLSVPTSTGDKFLHFDAYNYLAASLKNVSSAGTENYTNVVVTPKVQLRCVSRENAIIPAGRSTGLFIQENEVLLFQPDDYTKDISGTWIESDKVVAVFQGNNITRIPYGENWSDYTWEQALPTDTWGIMLTDTWDGMPLHRVLSPVLTSSHQQTHLVSHASLFDVGIKIAYTFFTL